MAQSDSNHPRHLAATNPREQRGATVPVTSICIKCKRPVESQNPSKRERPVCLECAKTAASMIPVAVSPVDHSQKHRAPCPNCGSQTIVGVPECPGCGHAPSLIPGVVKLPRPKGRRDRGAVKINCKNCSYDLTGLKAAVCPECGTAFSQYSRVHEDEEVSREVARKEYQRAAIMLASGVLLTVIVGLVGGRWNVMVTYGVLYVISVLITYCVSLLCFLTFMGMSSSLGLMGLQIVGIHAVCMGALAVVNSLGTLGLVWSFGVVILYVYMMSEMLDQDPSDARIIAMLSAAGMGLCIMVGRGLGFW